MAADVAREPRLMLASEKTAAVPSGPWRASVCGLVVDNTDRCLSGAPASG